MGRVIGKQGASINKVRQDTGARIDAEDKDDEMCEFTIRGSAEAVRRAKEMIRELAESRPERGASPEREGTSGRGASGGAASDVLRFPASAAGRIIGSRGAAISDIRQQSGAHVKVEKLDDCCKVHLSGSAEEVERARALLLKAQEDSAGGRGRPEAEEHMAIPSSMVGRLIGKGGDTINGLQKDSGAKIDVSASTDPPTVRLSGAREAVALARSLISELLELRDARGDGWGAGDGWGPGDGWGGCPARWGAWHGGAAGCMPQAGAWGPPPGPPPLPPPGPVEPRDAPGPRGDGPRARAQQWAPVAGGQLTAIDIDEL